MARVKGALNARKKHKKVLKLARGYRGARSKQYRVAKQSVMKAMAFAFAGRKQTKREYRSLWIVRINAAARMNEISYSKLIHGLKVAVLHGYPFFHKPLVQFRAIAFHYALALLLGAYV